MANRNSQPTVLKANVSRALATIARTKARMGEISGGGRSRQEGRRRSYLATRLYRCGVSAASAPQSHSVIAQIAVPVGR